MSYGQSSQSPESKLRLDAFELRFKWKALLADLSQFEAAVSLFLQDSELESIQEEDELIDITLCFRQSYAADYEGFKSNSDFEIRLKNYLLIVLGKEVRIHCYLSTDEDSVEIKQKAALRQYLGSPEYDWRVAQEENPLLKQMQELLNLEFMGTRKIQGETLLELPQDQEDLNEGDY